MNFQNGMFCLVATFLLTSLGCKKEGEQKPPKPVCNKEITFGYERNHRQYGKVNFYSSTVNDDFVSYSWDFGDGANSTMEDATHAYSSSGTYSVHFKATTSCGEVVAKDTSVVICSSCFEYRFMCDALNYTIVKPGRPTMTESKSGEYGYGAGGGDYLNTYFFPNQHIFRIEEGHGNLTNYGAFVNIQFGDSLQFTQYGLPVVNTGQGYTYQNGHLYASAFGSIYGTYYMGFIESGHVSVTRSDTLLEATFNTLLSESTSFNGDLRVSRYKYFYP